MRVATFHTDLSRPGPGLLLRDIANDAPDVTAVVASIAGVSADVIVLQDIDYDAGLAALSELSRRVADAGTVYPYRFALRPNAGMPTGLDLDGDGRRGGPRDAQGYGNFSGDGGMAILSRFPIGAATDLSDLLWRDLPGAAPPPMTEAEGAVQRLSSVGHWIVEIETPAGALSLLTWHATPPVFDGPEDRNGRRARDESLLWLKLLDGELGRSPPQTPFVLLGVANVDPLDGEGRRDAIRDLLSDPRLNDPAPRSDGGKAAADPLHRGDPSLDTVDYDDPPGNLRVSVLLPSADVRIVASGVVWPVDPGGLAADESLPRHRVVWADLALD